MKKLSTGILLFFFASMTGITAQSSLVTTGGDVTGNEGTVSFSAGQVFYKTVTGPNGSLLEGVQQPFEISVVTATKGSEKITLEFNVYPNPAADYVKLFVGTDEFKDLLYKVFSFNGLLLLDAKIEGKETEISLTGLSSSIYFLKVLSGKKEIKTFKIIKK